MKRPYVLHGHRPGCFPLDGCFLLRTASRSNRCPSQKPPPRKIRHLAGSPAQIHALLIPVSCDAQAIVGGSPLAVLFRNGTRGLVSFSSSRHILLSSVESCGSASLQFAVDRDFQDVMSNKAVNPSGGSGGFGKQWFLAAAGLPQSLCNQAAWRCE